MPNFHTHWLVALQALNGLPRQHEYLRDGRKSYLVNSHDLGNLVREHVASVLSKQDLDAAASLQQTIGKRVREWEKALRADPDAICFSAYMLGACGPDFWTLPGDTRSGVIPDTASHHFDLGHYNRTHLQFEVSLRDVPQGDDLQARVERSYFLGMATHVGADLVLHQLVNVSAGAYNLLKTSPLPPHGIWSNEQGCELLSPNSPPPPRSDRGSWTERAAEDASSAAARALHDAGGTLGKLLADTLPLWTTHNKVEHYWDTWVRHRWLGDFGKVWDDDVEAPFQPLGLPLCDTLRRDLLGRFEPVAGMGNTLLHQGGELWRWIGRLIPFVDHRANVKETVAERVNYALGSVETRWLLEKPLAFPWLFCDAVLRGKVKPFIYDRVVDKVKGAYPEALVPAGAAKEARHAQMKTPALEAPDEQLQAASSTPPSGGGPSELKKLQFFSTERNHAIPTTSWNYLNYITCPDLHRLHAHGDDRFYDRSAFPPFTSAAAAAARTFANELATAYAARGTTRLPTLGQFWNLDTGLGLRVESVPSPERHHVVTRLDWIHVLGPEGANTGIAYELPHPPSYAKELKPAEEPYPLAAWEAEQRAFATYHPQVPLAKLGAVVEDDAVVGERRYLDRLAFEDAVAAVPSASIFERVADEANADDAAFDQALSPADDDPAPVTTVQVPTGKAWKVRLQPVEHRLDLVIRASIPPLGSSRVPVAMYLLADRSDGGVRPPESDDRQPEAATRWLRERSQLLDRCAFADPQPGTLVTFSSRIIVNLSKDKAKARVVAPAGKWNNVVPWETHKGHYGRNFAVATARAGTLRAVQPLAPFDFDPGKDLRFLEGLGLTEHCFFTIYPLVRIGAEWVDAFSGEVVDGKALASMKKVEAINFVKLLLFYVLDPGGALQLGWAYVDGVRTRVLPAQA